MSWALKCLLGLGIPQTREEDDGSKHRNQLTLCDVRVELSVQVRDSTIRIVHPGGKVEAYQHPISARRLMETYPGMHVTRPEVFKHPLDSVLSKEACLLPGNKYYLVPFSTLEKMKRRYLRKAKMKRHQAMMSEKQQLILAIRDVPDSDDVSDASVSSFANDYFVYPEKWSDSLQERIREEKPFVPPIQKPRIWKEEDWEPSMPSIQEVSP